MTFNFNLLTFDNFSTYILPGKTSLAKNLQMVFRGGGNQPCFKSCVPQVKCANLQGKLALRASLYISNEVGDSGSNPARDCYIFRPAFGCAVPKRWSKYTTRDSKQNIHHIVCLCIFVTDDHVICPQN